MNFNKFSVSAKEASPLMLGGKDYRIHDLWWVKFTEKGWMKFAASLTARFSSINVIITKVIGHMKIGLFNLSYFSSIINTLITVSTHSCGNLSILKVIIREPNVKKRVRNSKHNT